MLSRRAMNRLRDGHAQVPKPPSVDQVALGIADMRVQIRRTYDAWNKYQELSAKQTELKHRQEHSLLMATAYRDKLKTLQTRAVSLVEEASMFQAFVNMQFEVKMEMTRAFELEDELRDVSTQLMYTWMDIDDLHQDIAGIANVFSDVQLAAFPFEAGAECIDRTKMDEWAQTDDE
jgi:predicted nuclease with TOPRIM domain